MKRTALTLGLFLFASSSHAAVVEFAPITSTGPGLEYSFTLATPTAATGTGVFTFSAFGDLAAASQNVSIMLEGFDLGVALDNILGNDYFGIFEITNPIDVSNGSAPVFSTITDDTAEMDTHYIGQVGISESVLNSMISDGEISGTVSFSQDVSYATSGVTIAFEEVAPVPLPASLGFLGLGMAGLGALRARRKAQLKTA